VNINRAVLCRGRQGVRLTFDHKAEDPSEKTRVEAAGGFILRGRVLGILAVARSFGDHGMKEFVTAQPHTSATELPSPRQQQQQQQDAAASDTTAASETTAATAAAAAASTTAETASTESAAAGGEQDCPFFILACDGVWDVLSDTEACELVLSEAARGAVGQQGAAAALVAEALRRGSTDNVTVLVVFL
jgi:serine/threonine protein phosphatase PrpC